MRYLYQRQCPHGPEEQEFEMKLSDPDPSCPECGKPLRRLIAPIGGVAFGPGFFKDGYSKPEKK